MPTDYGIKEVNVKHTIDETIDLISKMFSNTERHLEIIIDHDWLCHLMEKSINSYTFQEIEIA